MLNQSTLQTSRLGKSSSVKNNLGLTLGVDTPISFDSVRTSKIFPKNTLNLKQMLPRTTLAMEINQSPFSFGPQRTSRASIRNKSEDRKKEAYVASSAKLSDKGSEYSNGRDSTTRELRNLHMNIKDNCNYASLLMYIPDDMQPLSARTSKKAFSSFKELVKTSRGGYDELLEDIVIQDSYLKNRNLAPIQKELDQIGVVRKVLEYNKSQKNQYVKQMEQQNQDMLLPTIRKPQLSSRQALRVKIMPSKKLDDKDPTTKFKHKIFNADEVMEKALHYKSTPASPLHSNRRRDSKVRRVSIQKLEDKTVERMFSVYNYKIFWSPNFTNSSAWKPGVREGHTFTTVGRYVILYGGVSNTLLEDIVFYDPTTNTWIKPKVTGEIPMGGRHGHTACEFKRNLIVFGGEHHFNSTLNIRECLNDIRMFSPETTEWRYIRSLNTSITPRRYHAATLCDHTMFVYGGINNEGVYMKDVWTFSLKSFMWTKAEFPGDREPGIAFHGMAACFVERSGIQTAKDKERIHSFEEGFYVFGGKDGDGQILSSLKMFTADLKNTQWKYPTVKGNPPVARYNHSTLFYEPLGLLVIYGGKNETLFGSTHDYCLNDIKILHLEQMFWAETTSFGHRPQVGRYHHSVASFGTKMLIFGGVELYHYADDEVKFVELNQVKARRLIETDDTAPNNGGRKSKGGELAGLMGDDFAREELQVFEEFYSKEVVSWQPLPQAQLNYPEGETEIRLKLIENIQHREKNPNSPRKFVRQFTTIVMDDKLS